MNALHTQSITPLGSDTYQVEVAFPDGSVSAYEIKVEAGAPPLLQPDPAFESLMFRGEAEDAYARTLFTAILDLHRRNSKPEPDPAADPYDLTTPVVVPPVPSRRLQKDANRQLRGER